MLIAIAHAFLFHQTQWNNSVEIAKQETKSMDR